MKAQWGSKSVDVLLFNLGARWVWVVKATTRPLLSRERDLVPTVQEVRWAPGPVWLGAENFAFTYIRSPDRPARSESIYRLKYHGQFIRQLCNSTHEEMREESKRC
jgi:hypothetical protein